MTQAPNAPSKAIRQILPFEYVTSEEIQARLGVSENYVADLRRFFGLYPVSGGGGTPFLFLGETIHEAQRRFGRNEPLSVKYTPPTRDELLRMRKGETA